MSERPCPICRSSDDSVMYAETNYDPSKVNEFSFSSRKIPENMHHELMLCRKCSLIYTSRFSESGDLHQLYKQAAFDRSKESEYAAKTYRRLLLQCLPAELRRSLSSMRLLDIGAGDGAFLEEMIDLGVTEVRGVEPSDAPVRAAAPAVRPLLVNDVFRSGIFGPSSFDVVTCFQTIEHVPDPLTLVKDAREVLRPGGVLCIVCHNRKAISAKILGRKSPIFDIEHLQLFDRDSLRELFGNAGFSTSDSKPISNRYPLSYWIRLLPFPAVARRAIESLMSIAAIGSAPIPLRAGNLVAWAAH